LSPPGTAGKALEALAAESPDRSDPDAETHRAVCQCVRRLASTLRPAYADALEQIDVHGVPQLSVQLATPLAPIDRPLRQGIAVSPLG
jgi:hypothetical protein